MEKNLSAFQPSSIVIGNDRHHFSVTSLQSVNKLLCQLFTLLKALYTRWHRLLQRSAKGNPRLNLGRTLSIGERSCFCIPNATLASFFNFFLKKCCMFNGFYISNIIFWIIYLELACRQSVRPKGIFETRSRVGIFQSQ